ncbi:hypothetical protein L202_06263 [Cryptococcus amylolentus CBS 6039]|uniref:Alpha-L-rhamnosidase six-hairpin glycosidase domain-containing protein n=1 Tax=Cryptococcus amylolentus CBS 6039 TaxID=1295533 RepID=A0A1E3HFA3_9TREE|nr:hypothetical protein L202_06263 [Cryptococcus amylolentus CBS 6039]ODN75043.1 hypothetical protein L202_06263 [Cryptococcus amylolentus CBS 6039]
MVSPQEQKTINALQQNWVWLPNWIDSPTPPSTSAARLVSFRRSLNLTSIPTSAILHFSADTRYKLFINGQHVAVGPTKGQAAIWYYDTLDIAPYVREGENELEFRVIRYFARSRGGMPFERTAFPGLTVVGSVGGTDVGSKEGWVGYVDEGTEFPTGLVDDVFLHINERTSPHPAPEPQTPVAYGFMLVNGELPPWRLLPRPIPMPESTPVNVQTIHACNSDKASSEWASFLDGSSSLTLPGESEHELDIQADVHSTAFLRLSLVAPEDTKVMLKINYSEGYELDPRQYPWLRTKGDRLDPSGHLLGPYDEVELELSAGKEFVWEPFWFRTFMLLRFHITTSSSPITLLSLKADQVNYPMNTKASWKEDRIEGKEREKMWEVSKRTLRNCMFDGYSDCPFYEQLQYSGDSRSVALFHYLLSGDDRLMRQAITNFSTSITSEGLTQSRFPSHVPQVIAAFSLYWVLTVADHHLWFGDTPFARGFIPKVDGVLEYFERHVDGRGLVGGIEEDVWQYCDWVTTWSATAEHPDKGVPTSGRKSNRHTYLSLLYVYVLQEAAKLLRDVGRPGNAGEYEERAERVRAAVNQHCFDGEFYTDSTSDIADDQAYSQHCQIFAILSNTCPPSSAASLLSRTFDNPKRDFSKCSYVMIFYALRAHAQAGPESYERYWREVWRPWRKMLGSNLTTWEEDDVRQRSDCHAWGAVPVWEFCTELAGVKPVAPGCREIRWEPRVGLSEGLEAKVCLGKGNVARVIFRTEGEGRVVRLELEKAMKVKSVIEGVEREHGVVKELEFRVDV